MFGSFSPHTLTSAASLQVSTTTHSATPTSPTRPSRLRGLSYLRSYTRDHLHHHTSSASPPHSPSPTSRPSLSRSNSTPIARRRHSRSIQSSQPLQPTPAHVVSPSPQRTNTTDRDSPTSGWLPTVGGQSGLSRLAPQPQPSSTDTDTPEPVTMTRRRAATGAEETTSPARPGFTRGLTSPSLDNGTTDDTSTTNDVPTAKKDMPTLRLIPHHEPRSTRPSLTFPIVTRTLATSTSKVKVGRYSERDSGAADALTNPFSTAPVGFKSKVVSRRHCELWCEGAQWYIKDVKSSSGTFLNHVRLSSPGMESRAYPVNDGDIVQLGIDFKGGEEQIFRCVKIRVECNRGWQKSLNQFNTSTHKRLLKSTQSGSAATKDSDAQSTHSSECSICLCPVAPCQALFVAPCSHVWHYKCIRTLIYPNWPSFQCPNCRAYADLEADVDQPEVGEEEEFEELDDETKESSSVQQSVVNGEAPPNADEEDLTEMMHSVSVRETSGSPLHAPGSSSISASGSGSDVEADAGPSATSTSTPVPIVATTRAPVNNTLPESIMARSATPTSHAQFALAAGVLDNGGPTTPMNDSGPFIFDGANNRRGPRPVDDIAREPVREEREESTA